MARSDRALVGAFPFVRQLASLNRLKNEKLQLSVNRGRQVPASQCGRETLKILLSGRSNTSSSTHEKRCFENCLSIYGHQRVRLFFFLFFSLHSFASIFLSLLSLDPLSRDLPFIPSRSLSPLFFLFSSRTAHVARTATGGCFSNIVAYRVPRPCSQPRSRARLKSVRVVVLQRQLPVVGTRKRNA